MFQIIVVGGPAEPYIERCLQSIKSQKEDFRAQVVLDPVGDKTFEKARPFSDERIGICLNKTREYALPNIIKCIDLLKPEDDDVLVTLDADDWFSGPDALTIIKSYYDRFPSTLVTYGSWQGFPDPDCMTNCAPYVDDEFKRGIRYAPWKGTHTRTMRYKVWKNIEDKDLRDEQGNYFRSAWDLSFMWPALEMAGFGRSKYIPEKTYVYNRATPHSDEKVRPQEQHAYHHYLQKRTPYNRKEDFSKVEQESNLIIFSKDRAAQLDLLVRSMKKHFKGLERQKLHVLYTHSSETFKQGYEQFRKDHPDVPMTLEKDFKKDFLSLLDFSLKYTMLGVDDDVFLNPFSFKDFQVSKLSTLGDLACVSLRMHPGVSYCYSQKQEAPSPELTVENIWSWKGAQGDWGYPMSIDLTVFRTGDIKECLLNLPYKNPNTLEGYMAERAELKQPCMICYNKPCVVGIPVNKVQTVNGNHCGEITAEEINQKYLEGFRISLEKLQFDKMNAPHVETTFSWERENDSNC